MVGSLKVSKTSLNKGEISFLAVGKLRRPHGIKGEVQVELYTDFPERLRPKKTVYIGEEHIPLTIHGKRAHKTGLLFVFEGIDTLEQAAGLTNQVLYISSSTLPLLPEGEYYHHQILGSTIFDENGKELGQLVEILRTGANDVYVVKNSNKRELLIPAIASSVSSIDLSKKIIRVHLLPGLENIE